MGGADGDSVDVHEDSEVGEVGASAAGVRLVGPFHLAAFGRPATVERT